MNVTLTVDGKTFIASARQASTIQTLLECQKGGFANVRGYTATSGRVSPETANLTVLTRFSTERLYKRKIAALEAMTLNDIKGDLVKNTKIAALDDTKLTSEFVARKASEIASMQKTLDGVRDDARRAAHDRNYVSIGDGVKVHFVSEKNAEGIKVPVLNVDGLPTVESIMLTVVEIAKTVLVEGEYKKVNSGVPVLISNAMHAKLPKSTKIKTLSLKSDNFESLVIDGETVLPKDIAGDFT